MLNLEQVYDFFRERIKQVGLSCVSDETIAMPNIPFDPVDKKFWIELSMVSVGSDAYIESMRRHVYIAVISCCVPAGVGTEHVSNVSSRIAGLFDPRSPASGAYDLLPVGWLYVRGLDKETGYQGRSFTSYSDASVYKMDVRVTFELFEKSL